MTEPTPESLSVAHRYASGVAECAREIDALTEQRVAAAVQKERERCFTWALGRVPRSRACQAIRDGDDPHAGYLAKDPSLCWRCGETLHTGHDCSVPADRPAPEAAAPTKDGDTTRCSTPSQEDTGSVSGERWRHKKRGTTYTIVGIANSQVVGEPIREATQAVVYRSEDDGSLWLRRRDEFYDGRFERLPPTDAGGPGSASNTESSPTQTAAAPGPTAGDVERARADLLKECWHDLLDKDDRTSPEEYPDHALIMMAELANYMRGAADEARDELLAQIREPSEGMIHAVQEAAVIDEPDGYARAAIRALADKLTEAKP